MTVGLGMPTPPAPTLAARRKTRRLMVGDVGIGSEYPIAVQSMTTTKTHDVNATLQQIAELTATGCDIVRVACPRQEDADVLAEIARHSQIPVIADIHFQPKYIFAAIDAGCAAVRVNPGNIKEFDGRVAEVAKAAGDAGFQSASASTRGRSTSGSWPNTARPPPRRWSSPRCGRRRFSRSTASAISRSASSTTIRS